MADLMKKTAKFQDSKAGPIKISLSDPSLPYKKIATNTFKYPRGHPLVGQEVKSVYHKEAFKILEAYYQPGEFNEGRQKMIWMPKNAELILNPTSGAPGFSVENVFCLPGVPSILKSNK